MLQTRFPRLIGDIGNPASFPFATLYRQVPAATVSNVVVDEALDLGVAEGILKAASALECAGASLIVTGCGFLGALQDRLQGEITVPVMSSALVLMPFLRALYGAQRPIGVLSFDSTRLSARHFGVCFDDNIVIEGLETGAELHRVIVGDLPELDPEKAAQDALDSAARLMRRCPEAAAILFECTNLSPYRERVAAATGRPVYDLNQAILWHARALGGPRALESQQ
jgi:Asp/Glu/hydantoin racemase